jgi:hypothetical protein
VYLIRREKLTGNTNNITALRIITHSIKRVLKQ